MQLINTLVSTIQSLVSTASKTILPDSLREELKFLRSYVRFCIESGEAHTLPYLFPNEYQVSSFATSEITSINVSSTVLLLRAIARVSAKAAVFLSTSSTLSPLSTADTTRMTRSYTTSSLLSKSRIERNATKSTSTTAAAAATSPPPTSPYGLIYGPPSGFQNGLLAHKRALGVPEPTSFVGVTPELLIMEGGDVSIDVTAMTDVMGTRTAAGATATTASESDLATEEEEGQLSFMDLDLDVEEAQLWGTSDVSLVGPPESTTSGGSENGDEGSEAGTVVGWVAAGESRTRRLSGEKEKDVESGEEEEEEEEGEGRRQSSETLGDSSVDAEWEAFRVREIGIPENILRLEFEALMLAREQGKDSEKEDELSMW